MQEIKVQTKRGVLLDGVLFSATQADTLLIAITGIHGNFYSNPFYYNIGDTLNAAGIDFLYAQTNDAFGTIRTTDVHTGEEVLIGSWNERFAYTDEDIDRIIGQKFAKWQAEQDKKIKDAEAKAKMSAEELAAAEKAELEEKVKEYEAKETLANNRNLARQTLAKSGITVPDELLVSIVSADEAETQKAADAFGKLFKDEVAKAVGEKLKGGTPKNGSGGSKTLTKKEIMAIKNPAERQKLIAENIELFQ